MPPPPSTAAAAQPPVPEEDTGAGEEQEAKRRRLERGGSVILVPEEDYAAAHPGEVEITVQCRDTPGNKALNGQQLTIKVPSLTESVQALKELVASEVGLPANKLRLSREGVGFLTDALSLAHYNVGPEVCLQLTLKERGGRKK